jgi:hypothetical protein
MTASAAEQEKLEEVFLPEEDRMAAVIQELSDKIDGGQGVVRAVLYRITPQGDRSYLTTMPAEAFNLDYLRDTYGGGDYAVSIAVRGRRGVPPKNMRITIEQPPGWRPPMVEMPAQPVVDTPPAPGMEGMALLIEQSQKDRERTDRLIEVMVAGMRPPDPAGQMQAMVAAFQAFQAMIPRAPVVPVSAPADGLAQAAKLLELIRANTPATPGEATGSDVLLAAVNGLGPVMRDALAQQRGDPAGIPTPPIAESEQPVVSTTDPKDEAGEDDMSNMADQLFIAQMVASAKSGGDQRQWVEPILAVISPDVAREFLAGPDAIRELSEINPQVREHVPWFEKMGAVLLEHIDQKEPTQV